MLPIVSEHQRLELEEMQNMQKRQVSCTGVTKVEYLCTYPHYLPLGIYRGGHIMFKSSTIDISNLIVNIKFPTRSIMGKRPFKI